MQESDAIHLVCYMVLEYSGACVLHGTNKFWNYRDTTTPLTGGSLRQSSSANVARLVSVEYTIATVVESNFLSKMCQRFHKVLVKKH